MYVYGYTNWLYSAAKAVLCHVCFLPVFILFAWGVACFFYVFLKQS